MFMQATETYIIWALLALGIGVVISLLTGFFELSRARNLPFFLLRRQATERAWRNIVIGVFFTLLGLAILIGGKPLIEIVVPPTMTPTVSPTPTITPTITLTPTLTLTPSNTLPPTDTLTPSPTLTPSETPTPGYPSNLITNLPDTTVTPDPEAIIGIITVAQDQTETGQPIGAAFEFDASTLTKLVALYSYDRMSDGVQTSTVWYRDSVPIYVDTDVWEGGTGGSTVIGDECPLEQCLFLPGTYRVAIFVGDQLKRSADFVITGTPATRTSTPSNTPSPSATETASNTPTATSTASNTPSRTVTPSRTASFTPSLTPSHTATFTRTLTPSATRTFTASATPTLTRTRTATATRTITNTIRPVFLTDYARTAEAATATAQAGAP
jgi:hypothetical protein